MSFRNTTKSVSEEQQLRFAYLQVGQVVILATASIVNFGVSDPFQEQLCWCYSSLKLASLRRYFTNLFFCHTPQLKHSMYSFAHNI